MTPNFLSDLLPPLVRDRANYSLRNTDHLTIPRVRTETFQRSFIPSTIPLWNSLPATVRNAPSIASFKRAICDDVPSTKPWFSYGERRLSLIHPKLRMGCSNLNSDLCNLFVNDNPSCLCGEPRETATHYLLHCPLFANHRLNLLHSISTLPLPIGVTVNSNFLLFGSDDLDIETNCNVFRTVQTYIRETARFVNQVAL